MRKASRWFPRRALQLFPSNSSPTISAQRSLQYVVLNANLQRHPLRSFSRYLSSCTTRYSRTDNARFTTPVAATDDVREATKPLKLAPWMRQLNPYLPADIQISLVQESPLQEHGSHLALPLSARKLEKIILRAKKDDDTDLLTWLVDNEHRNTAVWLMESILNHPSSKKRDPILRTPSNIDWPQDLFDSVRATAIDLPSMPGRKTTSVSNDEGFESGEFESKEIQSERRLLRRVWETLGLLVIKSAAAGKSDAIDDNMLTALLVLGHIHNLGLMPDDVYAYNNLHQPTFTQRPPILNHVSSRILTALSDIAWRQKQNDAIIQAAQSGMSLKEISKNVPGGRFRLQIQPPGPEIWLELILWCCIESNQTAAALTIVRNLAAQTEQPWFANRWTSPEPREKLLVDVPEKTISVEVILALVEKLITINVSSVLTNTSSLAAHTIHKEFRSLQTTLADIQDVLTFLEPHNLPIGYFDYLETRLLQDDAFDASRAPVELYTWSTRMKSIRDLEKINPERSFRQTLGVEEIYGHSQLHMGFQLQAMAALMQFGDVHNTLAVFNEIQEDIDKTKVASITEFLQQQPVSMGGTPTVNHNHELEFTNCYGQIPYHKLAAFLNLITDTKLIGLGRWLLYADDVDGATLPEEARNVPCMTAALYRFAAVSQDEDLLKSTMPEKYNRRWRPTINMLRARFDANSTLLRLDSARRDLRNLRFSAGGGYGLSNVVHIAAAILRLEHSTSEDKEENIVLARTLLVSILNGRYATARGDFTVAQRRLFWQQNRCILRVFGFFRDSLLYDLAQQFRHKFTYTNLPVLPAKLFNVLLSTAVDTRGAQFGRMMWNAFCKTPDSPWAVEPLDLDAETLYQSSDLDDFAASDSRDYSGPSIILNEQTTILNENPSQNNNESDFSDDFIKFEDPFFPKGTSESEDIPDVPIEPQTPVPLTDMVSLNESNEEFRTNFVRGHTGAPLTVPNLQTLRLIVRAVADEMKDREEAGLGTQYQKRLIAWAVEMFKAFGISDRTVVEQETQYPLDELDAKITEESKEMIEAARQRDAYELERDQDWVAFPVSPMWTHGNDTAEASEDQVADHEDEEYEVAEDEVDELVVDEQYRPFAG